MTDFSDFSNKLSPIYRKSDSANAFVKKLFEKICDEESCQYLDEYETSTYRKYYYGDREISNIAADASSHIDKVKFADYIYECESDDSIAELCKAFIEKINDIDGLNYGSKIADMFSEIIINAAKNKGKRRSKKEILDTVNFDIEQLPIISKSVKNIIEIIAKAELSDEVSLNMSPVYIRDKINDEIKLRNKVLNYVNLYYSQIEDIIKDEIKQSKRGYDRLAVTVKSAYLALDDSEKAQSQIFDALVDWLCDGTNEDRISCEIIISYFIQKCEVFYDIT